MEEKKLVEIPGYRCTCRSGLQGELGCEKVPAENEAGKVLGICHEGHEKLDKCPFLQ